MIALGLGRVLAEVRARTPDYRRWWADQDRSEPGSVPPWSDADEAGVGQLDSLDPWWLRSVAGALQRAGREVADMAAELVGVAESGLGEPAQARCARLAADAHDRAAALGALGTELRQAGGRLEELLETAARRVLRVLDTPEGEAGDPIGRDGPAWLAGHVAAVRALRAELGSVRDQLPEIVRDPASRDAPGEPPPTWCPPELGCRAQPAIETPWTPEPGAGPLLPDTEVRRVEPGHGVRIALLPDVAPPAR